MRLESATGCIGAIASCFLVQAVGEAQRFMDHFVAIVSLNSICIAFALSIAVVVGSSGGAPTRMAFITLLRRRPA